MVLVVTLVRPLVRVLLVPVAILWPRQDKRLPIVLPVAPLVLLLATVQALPVELAVPQTSSLEPVLVLLAVLLRSLVAQQHPLERTVAL
jgi:hypothetical protein